MSTATPAPSVTASRASRPPRERLASVKDKTVRPRRPARVKAAKLTECPECHSTNVEEHEGHTVCGDCGISITESNIVSEVTFGESASGAAIVQGAYVGQDQRHARGTASWGRLGRSFNTRESREVSENNGREELKKQQQYHHLPDHIFEKAFSLYKLALTQGFNQGRQLSMVAAVCLYAICRREPEGQMLLIDFAEGIAVNVFRIGQTWQEMKKKLFLDDVAYRPVMDAEDMVARFMKKLEFGRDTKKVTNDALMILRRMKRDWMVTGRRPNGLIGACIIIAARMNNYRRTVREVVYVVKVADMTVAKRLEEFGRTPSAALTVDEFKEKGMRIKQGVPPSIYQAEAREAKKRKLQEILENGTADEDDDLLSVRRSMTSSVGASPAPEISLLDRPLRRDADGFAIPHPPSPSKKTTGSPLQSTSPTPSPSPGTESAWSTPDLNGSEVGDGQPPGRKKGSRPPKFVPTFSEDDLISEAALESEMEVILSDTKTFLTAEEDSEENIEAAAARATKIAQALRSGSISVDSLASVLVPRAPISDNPIVQAEEFEDDPEVAHCLLSVEEQRIKERIWVTHNEDWLRQQQAKMLKKALDDAHGTSEKKKEKKQTRRRGRMGDGSLLESTPALTASDAARLMLEKHAANPSRHINYANLDKLYAVLRKDESSDSGSTRAGSRADSAAPSELPERTGSGKTSVKPVVVIPTPEPTQIENTDVEEFEDEAMELQGEESTLKPKVAKPLEAWDSDDEEDDEDNEIEEEDYISSVQNIALAADEYGEEDEDAGFSDGDGE